MAEPVFFQFSTPVVIILLLLFYGGTFFMSTFVNQKNENVDGYMVSSGEVGFGISAASMTATWIWAASFYGAAISGYNYGLSGPMHYGFWGALMILFIYPYGLALSQARAPCPHPGRNHAGPPRQRQPAHSGGLEPSGQRHQPDGELHRGRRAGRPCSRPCRFKPAC